MEKNQSLPIYGVGPIYGIIVALLTVGGIVISYLGVLDSGKIKALKIPFIIVGIVLILYGVSVWARAVFQARVDDYIKSNHLCTNGIYASVRNPCYSGIMIACTGVLFFAGNGWLLILPVIYWIFMTILMKNTEEKWLTNLYGKEYAEYCKKVNRCIPWFKG